MAFSTKKYFIISVGYILAHRQICANDLFDLQGSGVCELFRHNKTMIYKEDKAKVCQNSPYLVLIPGGFAKILVQKENAVYIRT